MARRFLNSLEETEPKPFLPCDDCVANIDSAAPEAESSCKLKLSWVCKISFGEADQSFWMTTFICMGAAYIRRPNFLCDR